MNWKHIILWKYGNKAWISLNDLKESHPVDVITYIKARGIQDDPACA